MPKIPIQQYPRAIIWDFDGVIANTIPIHAEATRYVLEKENLTFDLQRMMTLIGRKDHEVFYTLVLDQKPDAAEEELRKLFQEKHHKYKDILNHKKVPLYSGVKTWIYHFQSKGLAQAIASSTSQENIHTVLSQSDLRSCFKTIVTGDSVANGKPAPDIYLLASQRLEIKPADCLVFEDSTLGVVSAKRANMRCFAICHTQPAESLAEADELLNSFEDYRPEDLFIDWGLGIQ